MNRGNGMITKPIPTQKQLDFMEWEFGLLSLIHI